MTEEIQRITRLEVGHEELIKDVKEIKIDVKSILEYQNKQKGAVSIIIVFFTALGALMAGAWDWLSGKH